MGNPPIITPDELRRLAFIRYLYMVALDQSRQPMPLQTASVLGLHDAVELFLGLACEHAGVPTTDRTGFNDYFDLIKRAEPPVTLAEEGAMRRLNKARVGLKHHGILVASDQVESFRGSAAAFFTENTRAVFSIDFDAITMTDLVHDPHVRASLREAERLIGEDQWSEALLQIAIAYEQLVDSYEWREWGIWEDGVVESMEGVVKVLALGLDFRRYVCFRRTAGHAHQTSWHGDDGEYEAFGARKQADSDDCRFCLDFVVECALRLQAAA